MFKLSSNRKLSFFELPIEIQDKIFLFCDYSTLQYSREFQSEYIRKISQFKDYIQAAKAGNLHCIKLLYRTNNYELSSSDFKDIIRNCNLEIVRWLYSVECFLTDSVLLIAVENPDVEVIKYLHYEIGIPVSENLLFTKAIIFGNFEVLKWLQTTNCYKNTGRGVLANADRTSGVNYIEPDNAIVLATKYGHLEILKWLSNIYEIHNDIFMYRFDSFFDIDILEFLYEKKKDLIEREDDTYLIVDSIRTKNLKLMKWVYSKLTLRTAKLDGFIFSKTIIPNWILREAINAGNPIENLKWLISVGLYFERNNFSYAFAALKKGNLEMVKLIRDNKCSFPKDSLSLAAKSGNLELMKWLHLQKFNFDQKTPLNCVLAGNFEALKWVYGKNRGKLYCKNSILTAASEINNLEIFTWLLEKNKNHCIPRKALCLFIEHCNLEAIKIINNYDNSCIINMPVNIDLSKPGALDIFIYYSRSRFRHNLFPKFDKSVQEPKLEILEKIYEMGYNCSRLKEIAVKSYGLNILKFAHKINPAFDHEAFYKAYINFASIKKLRWMADNGALVPERIGVNGDLLNRILDKM